MRVHCPRIFIYLCNWLVLAGVPLTGVTASLGAAALAGSAQAAPSQMPPVQEPSVQEPSVQEPSAQEPSAQEPSAQEPPLKESPVKEPFAQISPVKESPALELPAAPARALTIPLRDYRVQVRALNEAQAQLNFDAVFFGIEAFGAPIQITQDSPLIAQNPKGLVAFIASLIPVFQKFSDPAALEPYLLQQSVEAYRRLELDLEMAKEIVRIYRGVQSFELYCGWFTAPQEFLTVLKIRIADDQYLYSPVLFSFAEGQWKLVFGSSGTDAAEIRRGAAIGMALDNPRRFQMRYRKALSEEGATMPATNWRSFF